ncbi:MAG: glycosyltransferase family 2 protein [Acidobacteria bacterium]|nr:glycosyltransferase family 2 protein [Acidobacteriota bacterium]
MLSTAREQGTNLAVTPRFPKVSVIMPTYNTAHLICHSLDSVLAQTWQDFEIIVVNDGSPDTVELEAALAPYLDKITYIKQENKRAAGARNTAIRRARGEFLAFLDSDDSWLEDHLASQLKLLEQSPDLDLVYANCFSSTDPGREETFMDFCPSFGPAGFDSLVEERCHVPVSTVVVRKSIIDDVGGFDETLERCDDYDMWLRAAFHGAKIAYSQKVQARLNQGRPGCLSFSNAKILEADWAILEKLDRELPLSEVERRRVRQRAANLRAEYLLEEAKTHLEEGHFQKAKDLFGQANLHMRRWVLSLTHFSLGLAPKPAAKLISLARRVRIEIRSRFRHRRSTRLAA